MMAIKACAAETLNATRREIVPRRPNFIANGLIKWYPPPKNVTKINVDGSFFSWNNIAACGGIFRDYLDRFIKGFSFNSGSCSITHAELWGIIKGIQIAIINDLHDVIIETDSQVAFNFVKDGVHSLHPCAPLIKDIRILANRIQHINWSHTLREANSLDDLLAKKGQELPFNLHIYDVPPLDICYALSLDCFRTFRLRGS
ncbi:hypothetical protein AHAS_Ahas16G0079900 [Arachis hypogaea]